MPHTPEELLLLASLKINSTPAEREQIAQYACEISDWDGLTAQAIHRAIGPLLYKKLLPLPPHAAIPAHAISKLQQAYYKTLSRNTLLYDQFGKIVTAFAEQGIPVIVLKGIYLAEWLYGDIGLRQLSDIDLMVKKETAVACVKILESLGYQAKRPINVDKDLDDSSVYRHLPCMTLRGVTVELHIRTLRDWEITGLVPTTQWEQAKTVKIYDQEVYAFNTNDLLIHLCIHLENHFLSKKIQFGWYADITNILENRRSEIDWEKLEEMGNRLECSQPLFRQLLICHRFMSAPVPDKIATKYNHLITDKYNRAFFNHLNGGTVKEYKYLDYIAISRKLNGPKAKIRYYLQVIFPSKDYIVDLYKVKYEQIYFIYYPFRIFKGIKSIWLNFRNW